MNPLHRHQLVRIRPEAWGALIATASDAGAEAGLVHWASHDLPLVVANQSSCADRTMCSLGLPLPACWDRRRLGFRVRRSQLSDAAGFPDARKVVGLLETKAGQQLLDLCDGLAAIGLQARVYGSHGWQSITGLAYVHQASDLDLLIAVDDASAADAAAALLASSSLAAPRLDGELLFADGSAVAWREWLDWRHGRVGQLLLKRIDGILLTSDLDWLAQSPREAVPASA